jgi:uncharacterized protein with beta-barrel porin domain
MARGTMATDRHGHSFRFRELYSGTSALSLILAAGGIMAAMASPALSACTVAGDTLTCIGDLSAGVDQSSATVTTVSINSLTQDIGVHGVRFRNTAGLDVALDVNLLPHSIVLDPSATANARNGFHIITDGAIGGTVVGNITGPVLPIVTDPSGGGLNNYGVLGLDAETGIDVLHEGDIDATFAEVRRTGTSRGDITSGRFAAIRAETDTGDIVVENIGAISLHGVTRVATVENTTGGTAGARALQFNNRVSEHYGFFAQGNGDLTFTQRGDITITGGGALVTARTEDNVAEAEAAFASISGIDVPHYTFVGGVFNPNLPRFGAIVLDVIGNVSVNGGDVEIVAEAGSSGAGALQGSAIARFGLSRGDAVGVRVGADSNSNGDSADVSIDGDVTVTGGNGIAAAKASLGAGGETPGLINALSDGQDAEGVSIRSDAASLMINGAVRVVSGNGSTEVIGTCCSTVGTLYNDTNPALTTISASSNPGTALGIRVSASVLGPVDINGTIDVRSGDSFTRMTGSDMVGFASGGFARGLLLGGDNNFATSHDMPIIVRGGNAEIALDGVGVSGSASGSGASGASISGSATFSHTHTGEITAQGGNAIVTAVNRAAVQRATGGGANGIFISPFDPAANGTLVNEATIRVTGGDATANGPALDLITEVIGGEATGISAETFIAGSFASVLHDGLIVAISGNGDDARGSVHGIRAYDQGTVQLTIDDLRSGSSVTVTGRIEVEGEGSSDQRILYGASAGVLAAQTGTATITIGDGGVVEAVGSRVHGLSTFANQASITVESGAEVAADGADAHGIFVRSYTFGLGVNTRASTNLIVIENGATVTSAQGNAIRDLGVFTFTGKDFQTGAPIQITDGLANATMVDLAGSVMSGNGTAIDLGDGDDSLVLRSTAVVGGGVELGAGEDRFAFDDTFTITGLIDGGEDEDAVVADVGIGLTRTLDVGVQPIANFEVIEKLGLGELVLDGADLPTPYRLDALAGLTKIGRDFTNLSAVVSSGATLANDFSIGAVTTEGSGILMGNGTVTSLVNNGVVAPGNSIGTITVVGDATFNAGSVYELEIEAPNQSDRIDVGGTATIDGGALRIVTIGFDESFQDGQTYRILDADSVVVNDAFSFDQPLSLLRTEVNYGSDFVDLMLIADVDFDTLAQTYNQTQSGMGLQDLDQTAGSDSLAVFNEILQLSLQSDGADAARRAFDLASGEVHASGQHLANRSFGLFADTLHAQGKAGLLAGGFGFGAPLAYSGDPAPRTLPSGLLAADAPGLPVDAYADARVRAAWAAPIAGGGSIDGDGNAGQFDWFAGGIAAGHEGRGHIGDGRYVAGLAFGYLHGRGDVDARLSEIDSDAINLGLYGAWTNEAWTLSGAAAYAATSLSTERRIVFGGINRTAEAGYWTHTLGVQAEMARNFTLGGLTVSPLATLEAGLTGHGGFKERGAGALNLASGSESHGWFDTGVGLAVAHTKVTQSGARLTLEGRAVWEHAFADSVSDRTLSFAGSANTFAVRGPDAGRDRFKISFGATYASGSNMEFRARYDGDFSGRQQSHGASLGLTVKF